MPNSQEQLNGAETQVAGQQQSEGQAPEQAKHVDGQKCAEQCDKKECSKTDATDGQQTEQQSQES